MKKDHQYYDSLSLIFNEFTVILIDIKININISIKISNTYKIYLGKTINLKIVSKEKIIPSNMKMIIETL